MNKHEDMYMFNTIMKFTNRYDIANKVYDELFGKTWTIDMIEKYVALYTVHDKAYKGLDKVDTLFNSELIRIIE